MTVEDFLDCELINRYDYVVIRDYDDDSIIIERMKIKELWKHFIVTENYTVDEFEIMDIYCGGAFYDASRDCYRGYITLLVRCEAC